MFMSESNVASSIHELNGATSCPEPRAHQRFNAVTTHELVTPRRPVWCDRRSLAATISCSLIRQRKYTACGSSNYGCCHACRLRKLKSFAPDVGTR